MLMSYEKLIQQDLMLGEYLQYINKNMKKEDKLIEVLARIMVSLIIGVCIWWNYEISIPY